MQSRSQHWLESTTLSSIAFIAKPGFKMSLSSSDIAAIQGHWKSKVKGNLQAAGNALLHKYLTVKPEDMSFFKKFSSVALDDLCSNAAFNEQTLTVVKYLDQVVDNLGGSAGAMMKAEVPSHDAIGVTVAHFESILGMVGGVLAEKLGADAACVAAWNKAAKSLAADMRA